MNIIYCITPLAWVEIQCFALTAYMLTCSHAYMFTSLYACTLHYGTAAIPQKTWNRSHFAMLRANKLHADMPMCLHIYVFTCCFLI